jgi:7,8-dihydropterin-6-yl-methyl-4-(beta-D-ribofuranosyl)aminobenzene 5'-phosphate synthase
MNRNLSLTVIVEDSTSMEKPDLVAKHGLSLLVEMELKDSRWLTMMMDTGPSPDITLSNMQTMTISPQQIDLIILSHGHYDHTGGLLGVLRKVDKQTLVVAHPNAFDLKLRLKPSLKPIGMPFRLSDVESAGGVVLPLRNSAELAEGISTSGEIERETTFERVEGFWTVKNDMFVKDDMVDDKALLVRMQDKGLVVITGCAHAGIINTIRHAQKVMKINKIHAVVGGFHLTQANDERIKATIRELTLFEPTMICPCHCTGFKATRQLAEAFGDRCVPLRTGDILRL